MTTQGNIVAHTISLLQKWRLLQAVVADAALSEPAKIIAVRLLDRTNTKSGICWPSYGSLAAECGYKSRLTAKRAVRELERQGWLSVERSSGGAQGRNTNRFRPAFGRIPSVPVSSEIGDTDEIRGVDLKGSPSAGSDEIPESGIETIREGNLGIFIKNPPDRSACADDTGFDEFWAAYPKRRDKGQAREVYERLVRKGVATPAQLLNGAMRYGAERDGQDPQFTKGPVNWLNGECWLDEPTSKKASFSASGPRSKTSALGIAARAVGVQPPNR